MDARRIEQNLIVHTRCAAVTPQVHKPLKNSLRTCFCVRHVDPNKQVPNDFIIVIVIIFSFQIMGTNKISTVSTQTAWKSCEEGEYRTTRTAQIERNLPAVRRINRSPLFVLCVWTRFPSCHPLYFRTLL